MKEKVACHNNQMEFDTSWDDDHVVPDIMFPDLIFLFQRMKQATAQQVQAKDGERILDVGCGRAIDVAEVATGNWQCHGLEPSGKMLQHARSYLAENGRNVVLIRGIGEQLPFKDGTFDKVMCKGALDHFPNPEKAIQEMARVLKPGGKAIISIANFESLSFRLGRRLYRIISIFHKKSRDERRVWHVPEDHAYKFDYATLNRMVKPHLDVEKALGISLFFAFPWWGLVLHRMPGRMSSAILHGLDGMARLMPSLSDTLVFKCTPKNHR